MMIPQLDFTVLKHELSEMAEIGLHTAQPLRDGNWAHLPAAYEKYGTQSALHRGYYCPSPIYDVVIGNCKRGRILNSPKHPRAWFQYSFDEAGDLIAVTHPVDAALPIREYLFREGPQVIGVTLDEHHALRFVSMETYENGMLRDYKTALFAPTQGLSLWNFRRESYEYDSAGLKSADVVQLDFNGSSCERPILRSADGCQILASYQAKHQFARKGGYLSAYTTWASWNGEPETESHWKVTIRRKA